MLVPVSKFNKVLTALKFANMSAAKENETSIMDSFKELSKNTTKIYCEKGAELYGA